MTEVLATGLDELRAAVRGAVIGRDDAEYDTARALYNAMIDKRPELIVRCVDVADVIAAVNFGRENGIDTAIRCGGHNGPGLGSVDDGLVIDLSGLKGVRVDPEKGTADVAGGSVMGDIDHATHAFGMATPSGIISTTGVGIILGGGIGHLSRKYGLSIDNILGADVVLADGSLVRADENTNDDLYWAIRGGGGNFGVVTSLTDEAQSGEHGRGRPDPLAARPRRGRPQLVPRVHSRRARGPERVLRVPDRPTGAAVPGGAAHAEDVRRRLVLDRRPGRCGRGARRGTGPARNRPRRRAADAVPDSQ